MKQITLFATAIALTLYSLVVTAGTVTGLTTYKSGDTLTADQLNKNNTQIKSAVDNNATAIEGNTASIEGKVDKAGDTMSGSLTAPGFNYDFDQTRYAVVGIMDFVPFNNTISYDRSDSRLKPTSAGPAIFYAPVHLPQGAVITAIDFYTTDSSTTSRIQWDMIERVQQTGDQNSSIAFVTTGDDANAPGLENLSIAGLSHSVDNSQYYYQIRLYFTDGSKNTLFHSARITYIVGKPD
jgi:hypothetical protein